MTGDGGASGAADGPRRAAPAYELGVLAGLVNGVVRGDGAVVVSGLAPLAAAVEGDLSFVTDGRRRGAAATSRAAAFLVGRRDADALAAVADGRPLLVVDDAALALNELLVAFHPPAPRAGAGVHPTAVVAASAILDPTVSLGPYVVVGEGTTIAAGAVLHPHVVVGRDCRLGPGVVLHPHVVLYDGTELAARVAVHAGAVLGADGFGYASRGGVHHKVPQVGRVVVEEDVEIGANSAIDRAMLDETRVGAGTKIDNLVQVGHNVRIGRACILCGQVGIAGSTEIGDGVVLAGQVGVTGHVKVGDRTMVAAKSAVLGEIEGGRQVAGIPAVDLAAWRRQVVALARLDRLQRRVRRLEHESGADGRDGE